MNTKNPFPNISISNAFFIFCLLGACLFGFLDPVSAKEPTQPNHIVLVVLEGIGNETIKSDSMPVLGRLAKEGSVAWSAQSVTPPLTVPAMATLLTGLPIKKHKVTPAWEEYDFARSFLRSPTVFDYMDLAGGLDTAVFFMDERLYQLNRPEIYVDSQMCGYAKPSCTPETVSEYIRDYLTRVTSEGGHAVRLFGVPNLLLVHMPTASRIGQKRGWDSEAYRQAVMGVDRAINNIVKTYQEFGVLDETMLFVTGLNGGGAQKPSQNDATNGSNPTVGSKTIPWIAWGANVKTGYTIARPINLIDAGATILYALGLKTHTEWESHAIEEIFQSIPKHRTTGNDLTYSMR